eukprot:TRINITY_DN13036_c0_g1_i1.p1 TRINITY_DN13036_c0_g1~~TRINITY_DN13036_c0_g1_i1.p1  ORF type:complete len:263 (+),score=48.20 TRINITY_DN13036_c0_g1_i1:47-835(+)
MGNAQSEWKQTTALGASTTNTSGQSEAEEQAGAVVDAHAILEEIDGSNVRTVSLAAATRTRKVSKSPSRVARTVNLLDLDRVVLMHIAAFFEPKDHARVGQSCKALRRVTKRMMEASMPGKYYHGYGPANDRPERYLLFNKVVPPGGGIMSIRVTCLWKDQGWGNAKGRLYMRTLRVAGAGEMKDIEDQDAFLDAQVIATEKTASVAPRRNEKLDWRLDTSSPVVKSAKPGDLIEVQREIGGGGGHQLWIEDFKITILYKLE